MQIEQKNVKRANIFKVFFCIPQTFFTQKEKNVLKHNFTTKKIGDTSLHLRFNQPSQPLTIHRKALDTVGTNCTPKAAAIRRKLDSCTSTLPRSTLAI